MSLTFVVGTSRCGSTMLSRMLGAHPDVLSISEFWNCFLESRGHIPTHDMSGAEFWQLLADPAPLYDGLVTARIKTDEEIQPFSSRFNYNTGMPPICRILAWSTDKPPDPLYDSLEAEATTWPRRPMAEHCRALFTATASRLGRRVVVERTGGTLNQIELLREHFPEALFVFLHRDGPDAVLSMSRYPTLRLSALTTLAASLNSSFSPGFELLPEELRAITPSDFDGVIAPPYDKRRFQAFPIPLTYYAGMWSTKTRNGTRQFRQVPRACRMTLRYENLLNQTRAELTALARFVGVPVNEQWLDWACRFANPSRIGSASAGLHPMDLAELRAACAAGNRAFDQLERDDSG